MLTRSSPLQNVDVEGWIGNFCCGVLAYAQLDSGLYSRRLDSVNEENTTMSTVLPTGSAVVDLVGWRGLKYGVSSNVREDCWRRI
jgi:hypothetical protein